MDFPTEEELNELEKAVKTTQAIFPTVVRWLKCIAVAKIAVRLRLDEDFGHERHGSDCYGGADCRECARRLLVAEFEEPPPVHLAETHTACELPIAYVSMKTKVHSEVTCIDCLDVIKELGLEETL